MDLSSLKELGIGIGALCIVALIVKYFLQAMKDSRSDFCKLMSNHIEHNTTAIGKLDDTVGKLGSLIQANTSTLKNVRNKLE